MQTYHYRSVKAIAEHRYPQINKNHHNPSRLESSKIWHDSIPDMPNPARRKQRSNDRAPDSSRAA